MKSLNAKRIAVVAAGLAMSLAFAGQITFGNIVLVKSTGQPAVQIVVGSGTQTQYAPSPSDGVVAANIAAVIGNLAFTSTPITASISGNASKNYGLTCLVTTPSCTITNQQVYLAERGTVSAANSYSFKGLIGSVLNYAVQNFNNLANTKTLQGTSTYAYPDTSAGTFPGPYPISSSPLPVSAFAGLGIYALAPTPAASTNGGGVTFTGFTSSGFDNTVQFTATQVPGLMSSAGQWQESESLWIMGFPVFNQTATSTTQATPGAFQLMNTRGAYQVVFGKPINIYTNQAGTQNYASLTFLGQPYIIYGASPPTTITAPTSSNFVVGGSLQLAQASTPLNTVYVGQNITAGAFTVVLQDLTYPTSQGVSQAVLGVYNNGKLTNETKGGPNQTIAVNSSGSVLYIHVGVTTPGLYANQKWAQLQLFSNVFNVTEGKPFNTANPLWLSEIRWTTNQSSPGMWGSNSVHPAVNAMLQSIILYENQSKDSVLTPGSSYSFVQSPQAWKLTFVGDSIGTPSSNPGGYDPLTFSTQSGSNLLSGGYANPAGSATNTVPSLTLSASNVLTFGLANNFPGNTINDAAIYNGTDGTSGSENLFTVSSTRSGDFQIAGAPTAQSSLVYNLNAYKLLDQNSIDQGGVANVVASPNGGFIVQVTNLGINGNYVSSSNPLTVQIRGSVVHNGQVSKNTPVGPATFTTLSGSPSTTFGGSLSNVSDVVIQTSTGSALPSPGVSVSIYETENTLQPVNSNAVLLATLVPAGPLVTYSVPNQNYLAAVNAITTAVSYYGEGTTLNPQFNAQLPASNAVSRGIYFSYQIPLLSVPQNTVPDAWFNVGISNQSSVGGSPLYWLNESPTGNNNAFDYNTVTQVPQQGPFNGLKAASGFISESGSTVGPVGTTSAVLDVAKSVDSLNFLIGPGNSVLSNSASTFGPYGVGQATNIPNVSIANVVATCAPSTTGCSITGISNLTAVPSVAQATTPVLLNTAQNPLAILDTAAQSSSTLIVIGSKYVNGVAATIFKNNPQLDSSFGPGSVVVQAFGSQILVAGYTANETVQAGNQFITQLLSQATA